MGLNLTRYYSVNFNSTKRRRNSIKFIILHYTGMRSESKAIKKLCDPKSKVSSHYFIKNNGEILNLVPETYVAWHAGVSSWANLKSLNKYSIGIEISNPGHDYCYKKFSPIQIISLEKLLRYLVKKYNIKKHYILGHSDIAPDRKKDPGEKFPWKFLAKRKLSIWHKLDENRIKIYRKVRLSLKDENFFLNNLRKIGYRKTNGVNSKKKNKLIIKAFQRRFRQDLVDGKMDLECLLITKNLLKL